MSAMPMPQPSAGAGAPPGQASAGAPSQQPPQAQQPDQNQQAAQANRDAMTAFVDVAQRTKALAKLFPEFAESAAMILQELQKGMAAVSSNPERVPERKAPPNV